MTEIQKKAIVAFNYIESTNNIKTTLDIMIAKREVVEALMDRKDIAEKSNFFLMEYKQYTLVIQQLIIAEKEKFLPQDGQALLMNKFDF